MEFSFLFSLSLELAPLIMKRANIKKTNAAMEMYFGENFKAAACYDKLFHKRLNSF